DLGRWLRGEPIVARRVGRAEKFWLWCRRNPWVAGWAGVAAAAMVAGTCFSAYYAIVADRNAEAAARAQDEAERNLVNVFIRPLGRNEGQAQQFECDALIELADFPGDRLKLLFLQEVLSDPEKAARFAYQSERAVQAAVGANAGRRNEALALA